MFRLLFLFLATTSMAFGQDLPEPPTAIVLPNIGDLEAQTLEKSALLKSQLVEIKEKHEQIGREKLGWLSSLRMGVQFLNVTQDFDAQVTRVGVLPSLGVNIQIDFERLFTTPSQIRTARLQKEKAIFELNVMEQNLMERTQTLYYDLKLLYSQADIRYQTYFTISEQLLLVEQRFKRGEETLESYLKALNSVDEAKESYLMIFFELEKKHALLRHLTSQESKL